MKGMKICTIAAVAASFAFALSGCDDRIPGRISPIVPETVTLDETLVGGVMMEVGQTLEIKGKVAHTPADATDIAETYSSTDPAVVSIDGATGTLTANALGSATVRIQIGVTDLSVSFEVDVVDQIPIPATNLELVVSSVNMMRYGTYNLLGQVMLTPDDANDGIAFSGYDESIVAVGDDGILRALATGSTDVTVSSTRTPSLTASIPVNVSEFRGYYPRNEAEIAAWALPAEPWSLETSQNPLAGITDCGQGLLSPFDGEPGPGITCLALIRPGKSGGGISIPSGEALWFVVDMKQPRVVNRFKIDHRVDNPQVRPWGFDEISGSNDGDNFTTIATNVLLTTGYPGAAVEGDVANVAVHSNEVSFANETAYRYIRFHAQTAQCFYQKNYSSAGSAVQYRELNLGYFGE